MRLGSLRSGPGCLRVCIRRKIRDCSNNGSRTRRAWGYRRPDLLAVLGCDQSDVLRTIVTNVKQNNMKMSIILPDALYQVSKR
jgi:hypothetical protein